MLTFQSYHKTFLTLSISITSRRRTLVTIYSINASQKVKGTHLCLPLSIFISKSFGSKGPKPGIGGKVNSPKPHGNPKIPPSKENKLKMPEKSTPPSQPKVDPKLSSQTTYVGGPSKTFQSTTNLLKKAPEKPQDKASSVPQSLQEPVNEKDKLPLTESTLNTEKTKENVLKLIKQNLGSTHSPSHTNTQTGTTSISNDSSTIPGSFPSGSNETPLPNTLSNTTTQSSSYSNLTNSSFKEDIENIIETENLVQKALNMGLLVRRDALGNPNTGSEHLTIKGNILYNKLQPKEDPQLSKNPIDLSNTTFQTGTLTVDENKTLTPRSDQTHPVISTDDHGKIYLWGYLTSHDGDGNIKIANKQMDGAKTSDGKDKLQFYKPFEQPIEISSEDFTRNYAGDEYLQDPEISEQLSFLNSKASKYEPIPYKKVGLTKEELEAMVAETFINETEKALEEEKKPSNFLEDDKKKKKEKSEKAAKKNQEKQKNKSQNEKAKKKEGENVNADSKPKSFNNE